MATPGLPAHHAIRPPLQSSTASGEVLQRAGSDRGKRKKKKKKGGRRDTRSSAKLSRGAVDIYGNAGEYSVEVGRVARGPCAVGDVGRGSGPWRYGVAVWHGMGMGMSGFVASIARRHRRLASLTIQHNPRTSQILQYKAKRGCCLTFFGMLHVTTFFAAMVSVVAQTVDMIR